MARVVLITVRMRLSATRFPFFLAMTASLALAGCATDEKAGGGSWEPGKADGRFEVVEAGPADDADGELELNGRVPAYRIESFGDMAVEINLRSVDGSDPYLVVEGPLDGDGDGVAPGRGSVVATDDDGGYGVSAKLTLTLAQPGVYRILAGTYESLGLGESPSDAVKLEVSCSANCTRPAIDQKQFLALVASSGQLSTFVEAAKGELAALLPDPAAAQAVSDQLDAIMASPGYAGVERFPTIPLAAIGTLRPALGLINAEAPAPDAVVTGDLLAVLGQCTPDRKVPGGLHEALPGVGYGHFPQRTLSPCQAAHARPLAQVLTSLAADNGSSVTYRGKTLTTPEAVIEALVASGHSVQVRNERTYANFASLTLGDRDIIWPVWLDTGIKLSNGQNFVIPMGHSHHAWRITGPQVNARVMFYLGTSGAAFFGQANIRPAWTGHVVSEVYTVASVQDTRYEDLLATLDYASRYLRRIRVERSTVAQGMPNDGYGFVGVCNDSNAAVELATAGTISTFPLVRAKSLDGAARLGDGLDDLLIALPNDADGITDVNDALRRAVDMIPHPADAPALWDATLTEQNRLAREAVGK